MSTIGQLKILADKADELSVIMEFVKNPGLLDKLKAGVKELNALAEAEEAKLVEAKNFLAQHAKLSVVLKAGQDELAELKAKHADAVVAAKAELDEQRAALAEAKAEVEAKAKALATDVAAHAVAVKKLISDCDASKAAAAVRQAALDAKEAALSKIAKAQDDLATDLAIQKKKLEDTAAAMKGLIAG